MNATATEVRQTEARAVNAAAAIALEAADPTKNLILVLLLRLVSHPTGRNVRKIQRMSIPELSASIQRVGLLQNLIVIAAAQHGEGSEHYEVVAGGRWHGPHGQPYRERAARSHAPRRPRRAGKRLLRRADVAAQPVPMPGGVHSRSSFLFFLVSRATTGKPNASTAVAACHRNCGKSVRTIKRWMVDTALTTPPPKQSNAINTLILLRPFTLPPFGLVILGIPILSTLGKGSQKYCFPILLGQAVLGYLNEPFLWLTPFRATKLTSQPFVCTA